MEVKYRLYCATVLKGIDVYLQEFDKVVTSLRESGDIELSKELINDGNIISKTLEVGAREFREELIEVLKETRDKELIELITDVVVRLGKWNTLAIEFNDLREKKVVSIEELTEGYGDGEEEKFDPHTFLKQLIMLRRIPHRSYSQKSHAERIIKYLIESDLNQDYIADLGDLVKLSMDGPRNLKFSPTLYKIMIDHLRSMWHGDPDKTLYKKEIVDYLNGVDILEDHRQKLITEVMR